MFSLVITLVAIALVVALALAAIFYGAPALKEAGAKARSTALITQSTQVLGAAELHLAERRAWPASIGELVDRAYLKNVPVVTMGSGKAVAWAQPMPNVPTFWALMSTDAEACRQVNLKARGDNGIYNKARPGLVTQCFGTAEPFTTLTTRRGLSDSDSGLDVVFDFYNERNPGSGVEYAPDGGGWAVEPTLKPGSGGGSTPGSYDPGNPDGSYLGGGVHVSLPGGIGTNTVNVGSVGSNGTVQQEVQFTNTGGTTWTVERIGTCAPFRVVSTTCTGDVRVGQTCKVVVQAGPFTELAEPQTLQGCIEMDTSAGSVRVPVQGTVQPSAPGPVQVGVTTNDPGDTATQLVFPDTEVGQTSYKWVRVQNVGSNMTYAGTPLTALAPFSVVETDCGGQQAYGAYCWARLAFTPMAVTLYTGAEHPMTLNANGQTVTVGLSGRGTPKPAVGVSLLPDVLDFGLQPALGQYTLRTTVRNDGDGPLIFSQAPNISEGANSYRISVTTCTSSLPAKGTCYVTVQFYPDTAQVHEGKLAMAFNELGERTVSLTGSATNPLKVTAVRLPPAVANGMYVSPDLAANWSLEGSTIDRSQLFLELAPGTQLPAGLRFDAATRTITGTMTESPSATELALSVQGTYLGRFRATQNVVLPLRLYTSSFRAMSQGSTVAELLTPASGGTALTTAATHSTVEGPLLGTTALTMPGTASSPLLPNNAILEMRGDFSVSFWAKTTAQSSMVALGSNYPAVNNQIQLNENNKVGWVGIYMAGWQSFNFGVDTRQWHYYKFQRQGTKVFITVDNQTVTFTPTNVPPFNVMNGAVGGLRNFGGALFKGAIYDLNIEQ